LHTCCLQLIFEADVLAAALEEKEEIGVRGLAGFHAELIHHFTRLTLSSC
jgi:hypothetical protein